MKLYLIVSNEEDDYYDNMVFGVFSTRKQAKKIKNKLDNNFKEHHEAMRAKILELELDEVTEDYDFIINN